MSLPEWVDPGLLPPGRHRATLEQLHQRCVAGAANSTRRQELFDVLLTFLNVCRRLVGPAAYWIDGGFVTNKPDAPYDVDVAILPDDWEALKNNASARDELRMWGLLTLQDLIVGPPTYVGLTRLQPLEVSSTASCATQGKRRTGTTRGQR
jgi:hypothetical protein